MPIKSFRGRIAAASIDKVVLHTNNGTTGYKIKSLSTIIDEPAAYDSEATLKIFSVPQTTTSSTIDFSDQTLLGVAYTRTGSGSTEMVDQVVIFDHITFNQDIYITAVEPINSRPNNYLIELEQVQLDLNQNTVATLKDIRNITAPA